MSGLGAAVRRHRATVAANLALLMALSGAVYYAVSAEGFTSHRAELNDGGIWISSSRAGFYGRINKPVGQQDAGLFAGLDATVDIVQDGAAVVGVNRSTGQLAAIDPATVRQPDQETAGINSDDKVQLAGGTLAVLDPGSGSVRAVRVDTVRGASDIPMVDAQQDRLARVGGAADLAVTAGGAVLAASADTGKLLRIPPRGVGFGAPVSTPLPSPVTGSVALTAVGDVPVVADLDTGNLVAVGGAQAAIEPHAVLQQPGPSADSVLVATASALATVDLRTGELNPVAGGLSGRPAAPVRLGGCVYGAWSGTTGVVVTRCGADAPQVAYLRTGSADLVFRVNRGQILLNDRLSGAAWNLDTDSPSRLDDWESFTQQEPKPGKRNDDQDDRQGDRRPPRAKPDALGARPGRTTLLHPLDNDSAPSGRVLSIRAVQDLSTPDAELSISPDGQTVALQLPQDAPDSLTFDYVIDDGRDVSDHAQVRVSTRGPAQNQQPRLRHGYRPRNWAVPAGGAITLPVLPDWRDPKDGDPVSLVDAQVVGPAAEAGDAVVRTTPAGAVRLSAPQTGGPVQVEYAVSDGLSAPVREKVTFRVQDTTDSRGVAPVTFPDIVSVDAGGSVTISPLANDMPGSDPRDPDARLALAGRVASVAGARVRTDLADGTVTFRASRPRTYFLGYDAVYGTAPLARGKIRVDVHPRESDKPVAMPDTTTVHGQAPTLVDVLANDLDPTGGLLVVQSAWAQTPDQVDVAVVDGRWLRISPRQGELVPSPQVVRYLVGSGTRTATGEVTVMWRPVPEDNAPVTEVDSVTVRAGSSVVIPVLDNDLSPSGDPLSLQHDVIEGRAGELPVARGDGGTGAAGRAFVSGRLVRYVAPADVGEGATYHIEYVALNTAQESAPGRVDVNVIPATRANRPPEPAPLQGRVVAGDTVKLTLPGADVDPDGDPVSLVGLSSAPRLGRLVSFGANSMEYQAYPGSAGTEQFAYTLTDSLGGTATGVVRIAVVPPGRPQPPLAVADEITLAPGRVATVDVVANDLVASGDQAEVELLDPPVGVRLESADGAVSVTAPSGAPGQSLRVAYRLTNGIDSSQATLTVRTARPYNNPPVVFDAFGASTDSALVSVDVLASAYDPDGPASALRIAQVFAPPGVRHTVSGGEITLSRGPEPTVVAYRVTDGDGGSAMAHVYVPATGTGLPYVKPDALIELEPGGRMRGQLADYLIDPSGGTVRFVPASAAVASPVARLNVATTGEHGFSVQAADDYVGPGAVAVEVTNRAGDPGPHRTVVTIPVQVGSPQPILHCPETPVVVPRDQSVELDVTALCHVWTEDPAAAADLVYRADWERSSPGLAIIRPEGSVIEVHASGDSEPGARGVLLVRTGASEPGRIRLEVGGADAPTLSPISVSDMEAGQSQVLDLAGYLRSTLPAPNPTVVAVEPLTSLDVSVEPAGGSQVRITTGGRVSGHAEFRVTMSDTATGGPARQASNILSLDVLDVPATPAAPVPGKRTLNGEVHLTWQAPAANGAPIDGYEVRSSAGRSYRCPSTACAIQGLQNGTSYTFRVRAHNALGWSELGPASRGAMPDATPGQVGFIRATKQVDRQIFLAWSPPQTRTSEIEYYEISWAGGSGTSKYPSFLATGLDNDVEYRFTVVAVNAVGVGEKRSSPPYQPQGNPDAPDPPTVRPLAPRGDEVNLVLTWGRVDPHGPGQVLYSVLDSGTTVASCTGRTDPFCTVPDVRLDGTTHQYAVRAVVGKGNVSTGHPTAWTAVLPPDSWADWTIKPKGSATDALATFTVPESRGSLSEVTVLVDGRASEVFRAPAGLLTDKTIAMPDNDRPHTVRLRLCNERSQCSDSADKTVQTWGSLKSSGITVVPRQEGPTSVSWTVTVDANGAPAQVTIESDYRPTVTATTTDPDVTTFRLDPLDLGWSTTEEIRVTVVDPARGRGPVTRSESFTTDKRPPPEVKVRAGPACSDAPGSTTPCNTDGQGVDCTDASCAFIKVTTVDFGSPVSCRVDAQGWSAPVDLAPMPDNATTVTSLYYGQPGKWVRATCTDQATGARNATDQIDW